MTGTTKLACACGKVHIEVDGAPIISTECHCSSCREAAVRLQPMRTEEVLVEPNGGTRYVLYRKDRIRFVAGKDLLREFRLKGDSKTRRVVADCCKTPLFLEFSGGHWLSVYAHLWPQAARPPLDERTMTSDVPVGISLTSDVPSARHQSFRFMRRLLGAWIAMGFKAPKIDVAGTIKA